MTSKFDRNLEVSGGLEYTPPPKGLEHFSFGHQNAFADGLWLRAIQDFDFCEKQLAVHECKSRSWLFQVLDVSADLSPTFLELYQYGAIALSVIISDQAGASVMFDRGIAEFPADWKLSYKAAYHALFEEKNKEKAAHLLEQSAKNGAPAWVYATATKLYSEAGVIELAAHLYDELAQSNLDPGVLKLVRARLVEQARKNSPNSK